MTEARLKGLLDIRKSEHLNDVVNERIGLKGNGTNSNLITAIGEKLFDDLTNAQKFELWHILTYTDNTEKLKQIVRNKIAKGILPADR